MSVRWVSLIAAVITAAIAVPASAQQSPARGQIGIRLVDIPADRSDDPRARVYVVDHLAPGESLERRIEVTNTTGGQLMVSLDVEAAEVEDGSFRSTDDPSASPLVGWASITPDDLVVPPGQAAQGTLSIDVPPDAPTGEYYAAVWAQPPAATVGATTVVNRVGIRVYLSVGEGDEPVTDFRIDDLVASRADSGVAVVQATLTNTGGRAIDVVGELVLSDGPGGISAGPFSAEPGTTIGVGQTGRMTVLLDPALPDGPWKARLDARSGLVQRSAEATILFPEEAGSASAPVDATPIYRDRGILLPLALGLLVLAFVLVLLVWLVARRRDEAEDEVSAASQVDGSEQRITT